MKGARVGLEPKNTIAKRPFYQLFEKLNGGRVSKEAENAKMFLTFGKQISSIEINVERPIRNKIHNFLSKGSTTTAKL